MERTLCESLVNAELSVKDLVESICVNSYIYIIVIVSVRFNIRLSCFAEVNIEYALGRAVEFDVYSDRILNEVGLDSRELLLCLCNSSLIRRNLRSFRAAAFASACFTSAGFTSGFTSTGFASATVLAASVLVVSTVFAVSFFLTSEAVFLSLIAIMIPPYNF